MSGGYDRIGIQMQRFIFAAFFAALVILPVLQSQAASRDPERFEWSQVTLNGAYYPKAAILVPVRFPGVGQILFAQLDTGSDGTMFYAKILIKHGIKPDTSKAGGTEFSWAGGTARIDNITHPWALNWSMDDTTSVRSLKPDDHIVGTIGMDQIVGKLLVLDFPRQRFMILADSSLLPDTLKSTLDYTPGVIENLRLYVPVVVGSDTVYNVLFDTGSSISTLTVPIADWRKLTGLNGDEPSVRKDTILSWGQKLEMLSAPAKADLTFGRVHIHAPIIDCVKWKDSTLNNIHLMGNAPFYDSCTVVLDCKYSRLGVAK
jgi:hypothetical protein